MILDDMARLAADAPIVPPSARQPVLCLGPGAWHAYCAATGSASPPLAFGGVTIERGYDANGVWLELGA